MHYVQKQLSKTVQHSLNTLALSERLDASMAARAPTPQLHEEKFIRSHKKLESKRIDSRNTLLHTFKTAEKYATKQQFCSPLVLPAPVCLLAERRRNHVKDLYMQSRFRISEL